MKHANQVPVLLLLIAYLALPQNVPHGMDTHYFITWVETGQLSYPRHLLYLHIASALRELLHPLGLSTYQCLLAASALCAAIGVLFLARAARRLLPAGSSPTLVALGCGVTPAVFYFATAAEIHGVFFAFSGLSWWLFAVWNGRRTWTTTIALGVATGVGALVHATGHLQLPLLLLACFCLGRRTLRDSWRQVLAIVATHAVVTTSLALLLQSGSRGSFGDAVHVLDLLWQPPNSAPWPILWREWVYTYLPWSALLLLGLLPGRGRSWSAIALIGLLGYLPFTLALLWPRDIYEVGAYQLPLAFPALCFCACRLPRWGLVALLLGSAAIGVHEASRNWEHEIDSAFAEGVAELYQAERFLLICDDPAQVDRVRTVMADIHCIELSHAVSDFVARSEHDLEALKTWFDGWVARMHSLGARVLFTDGALKKLSGTILFGFDRLYREHLEVRYRLTPVERAGFRGVWVDPR